MDAGGEDADVIQSATERLLSGEYPESIARDLREQTHLLPELRSLFQEASAEQRRRGRWRIIVGSIVTIATIAGVIVALGAGCVITGPGLLIGLYVLAAGLIRLRNSKDILLAIPVLETPVKKDQP